jgi:hypothetical protein
MYQVSVHLAEGFQRRRLKCEKLTDDRRRMTSDGKSSSNLKAILVSDWLISEKSSPLKITGPNESKFGRKHPWKVLYK